MQVIELRNYLLRQDAPFIRYFEEHFLLSQRAEGMHPLGQFEVVGEPDRFVWIRGFDDMATRLRGLSAFYGGPFWHARRDEANAMMLEHHNVHLLRPLGSIAAMTGGATLEDRASEPPGAVRPETGLVVVDFYRTEPAKLGGLVELFEQRVRPALLEQGHHVLGHFVAELRPNDYPRLPVIQDPALLVVALRLSRSRALRRPATRLAPRGPGPAGRHAAVSDQRGGDHLSAADRPVADSLPRRRRALGTGDAERPAVGQEARADHETSAPALSASRWPVTRIRSPASAALEYRPSKATISSSGPGPPSRQRTSPTR